jgi:hypothetical protein
VFREYNAQEGEDVVDFNEICGSNFSVSVLQQQTRDRHSNMVKQRHDI